MRISDWSSDVCSSDLLPRNDIGHRLHVDVFPVRSGFIDMLICNLLGHEGVRSVADLLLNFRMPWVPHGLILGLASFPFEPLILIAVIVRNLRWTAMLFANLSAGCDVITVPSLIGGS